MPTTSSSARPGLFPVLLVLAAACALLTGAVTFAGPAAAIEDPRRPTAEVTQGPSCGPAAVRVTVTNGSKAHHVALVLDGVAEQDAADVGSGEQAQLASGDIEEGRTVDVTVAVTDLDGTTEEPLRLGTYTRPGAEDCAAVTPSAPVPGADPTSAVPATSPTTSDSAGGNRTGSGEVGDVTNGAAAAASVSPGGVVTVRAAGFEPGEAVTVSLLGAGDPLTTVTAGRDGRVEAVVQIPRNAALGAATVQLVGGVSDAVAGLELLVAARSRPVAEQTTSAPVRAAGLGLIGAAAVLGLTAARRARGQSTRTR